MSNNKNNEFKNKKNSFEFFSIPTEEENKNLINNNYKEKDLIAYKLYKYYENLKKFVESFIINLKIIG